MKNEFTAKSGPQLFKLSINQWYRCCSLLFFLSFSLTHVATAQNKIWDKTIGGFQEDVVRFTQQTSDGGFIVGGSSYSDAGADKTQAARGKSDYWVVKLKADGTKAWDKTFGGKERDELVTVQQTQDGGYILGGSSYSSKGFDKSEKARGRPEWNGEYPTDIWIIKLNQDGTKVWDKTIGGNSYDLLSDLKQTPDGGYILGGTSASGINGDKSEANKGVRDYWVIKLKVDGTKVWDRTFGGSIVNDLSAIEQFEDGSFLVGGTSESGKSGDKSEPNKGKDGTADIWLIKLKADGTKVWDKTIGGNSSDYLADMMLTRDGGYILGGGSRSDISGDKSEARKGEKYTADFWVIKYNANNEKEWDRTIGGNQDDGLSSIQQTSDGGYILGGTSDSDVSGDKTEPNYEPALNYNVPHSSDFWVVKLKADGRKHWDRTFGGTDDEYLSSVLQTKDGSYLLSGRSVSSISNDKSEANKGNDPEYNTTGDYWVIKLDNVIGNRQQQQLTFNPIYQNLQDSPVTLKATSTAGLPVSFKVLSGPAKIKNNQLFLTDTGTVILQAFQSGNATYGPVAVNRRFQVYNSPISQVWNKTYGGVFTAIIDSSASIDNYPGGFGSSRLAKIIPAVDGGYILGGTSDSRKGNDKSVSSRGVALDDYWLVKTDANGRKLWDKTFGGDQEDVFVTVIAAPDGGYLLGGKSRSGKSGDKSESNLASTGYDYWLVKVDANGNKLWDKTLGTTGHDVLTNLVATPDGGYLLGDNNFSVTKIDATGKQLWKKSFPSSTASSYSQSSLKRILLTADGHFLLGFTTETKNNFQDYRVLKLDINGNTIWDKTFGGSSTDQLVDLVNTPDGGYLLGGISRSLISGDKTQNPKGDKDYWIVKIDSKGKKLWDKTLGTESGDNLSVLTATPDGNFLLGGTTFGSKIGGDKSEATRGLSDYWVVKVDAQGQKIWDKSYGNYKYDMLTTILVDATGDYLLGGTSDSDVGGDKSDRLKGLVDFWVLKVREKSAPQTATWNMRYGGSGTDNLTSTIKTQDGGYLAAGYTNSGVTGDKTQASQGKNDYWIVKSDAYGKKLWDKRFGGYSDDYLNSVIQTQDGGYLLAGSSFSGKSGDKSQVSRGGRDYWLVKTDAQGNKQWDKRYGGTGEDELKKVLQLASGRYILAGTSDSPVSGDKSKAGKGGQDYWVLKINPDGQKVWDRSYGGSADDILEALALAVDGNLLLGGSSTSSSVGDRTQGNRGGSDYWVLRLDGNGEKVWDRCFGGAREDQLRALGVTPTGNLYLAGTSTSKNSGEKTQTSQGGSDYWLLEISNSGNKLWDKAYGGSQDEELRLVVLTPDQGYLLAGSSASGVSGSKTQTSQGATDYWVVKLDQQGNYQWDQRQGGSGAEELRAALLTPDNGYLLAGRSGSGVSGDRTQPSQGSTDYWLVKIAAPTTTSMVASRTATLAEEPAAELATIKAYPNPFSEKVTIHLTLPQTQAATVRVLDSQGREITTLFQQEAQANQTYQLEWQAGKQETGMYLLQLQTPTGQSTRKVILRK